MIKQSDVVASVLLVDPVCFKLYDPALTYRFVYRIPRFANEHLIHWIVSRELYISYYISRYFTWHQNILFPEGLPVQSHVILSEHDNLIDMNTVYQYLTESNQSVFFMTPTMVSSS